jgi:hypothetical protein
MQTLTELNKSPEQCDKVFYKYKLISQSNVHLLRRDKDEIRMDRQVLRTIKRLGITPEPQLRRQNQVLVHQETPTAEVPVQE